MNINEIIKVIACRFVALAKPSETKNPSSSWQPLASLGYFHSLQLQKPNTVQYPFLVYLFTKKYEKAETVLT